MREYRHILAVVTLDAAGRAAAFRAAALARLGQAELTLFHVIEADIALDGGYQAISSARQANAYVAVAERQLRFWATSLGHPNARIAVQACPPRQAFAATVATNPPDLVVADVDPGYLLGTHDLLTLGRASDRYGGWRKRLQSLFGLPHLSSALPDR